MWSLFHFRGPLIASFINEGYDVVVITPNDKIDGNKIYKQVRHLKLPLVRTSKGYLNLLYTLIKISQYIRIEKPNIVYAYTLKPILICGIIRYFYKFKFVSIFAGLGELLLVKNFKKKIYKILVYFSLQKCSTIFLSNMHDQEYFRASKKIMRKIKYFPDGEGIDLNHHHRQSNGFGYADRDIDFLVVCRLIESKGILDYIEAARIVKSAYPSTNFVVCGFFDREHPKSVSENVIHDAVAEGIIDFVGTLPETKSLLDRTKYYVMPSYYNEGMNRSIMDALVSGVPVITTDNRGCAELVKEGLTGFVVPTQQPALLAAQFVHCLKCSEASWNKLSTTAKRDAELRFDINKVIEIYKYDTSN